jgi:zinc protease
MPGRFPTNIVAADRTAVKESLMRIALLCALLSGLPGSVPAAAAPAAAGGAGEIDIPYTRFVLDNGLRLIVHEDHKAPIVAVNVWYHVGSKNEKPGKTGFAHLFEHLMFNGSENHDDDYMVPLDRVGATDRNGTTNPDRTNYFQNVPTPALDLILWLESDRMGHLLGAVTQKKLDEQRGVVQNEKRQGEDQPYGRVFNAITENAYPREHPYSWPTIGSMEDLGAATLDDVHDWFRTYYGAANAVVVIAGDIDPETARRKVEAYFGDIPAGPPLARHEGWIARRTGTRRQVMEDRVPQARIYKVWNVPERDSADTDYLEMVGDLLSDGKTSRLYRRLVYEDQIATDVSAFTLPRELGSLFFVQATAQPGGDLGRVERALDEEMARFLDDGPQPHEVARVRTQLLASFVRGIERIGGFGGKSDILASSEVFGGSPDHYKVGLDRVRGARPADLRDAARRWLDDGVFVLEVRPYGDYRTVDSPIDRARMPETPVPPASRFPRLQRAALSNGLRLIVAENHAVPIVRFDLLLDAGYAADTLAVPGTANLALDMLDEGTASRTALEIAEQLDALGAKLDSGSSLDTSSVTLSALREHLDGSLAIYADVILNPSFPGNELERRKKQVIAGIQQEKTRPFPLALRVMPALLYGRDHAYGIPFTGSGTEEEVAGLTRDDLVAFHDTWFKPGGGTMIVVGDTTLDEIRPRLERLFSGWKGGEIPAKNLATVRDRDRPAVYLIDRPGSEQSMILAGHLAPPRSNPDEVAIEAVNEVLGGSFNSRLNMNLREEKGWSYGSRSFVFEARGQRPLIVYAPVQTDRTIESMVEIRKELEGIVGGRPPTGDEVARARDIRTLALPGRWETGAAVSSSIAEIVTHGLPDDFWDRYPEQVRGVDRDRVAGVAKRLVHPDRLVWVVVGDRRKIEQGVRDLGIGEIAFLDADGNPLGAAPAGE